MPSGYSNSAGVDFDDLFEPGSLGAAGFLYSDGTELRYAPRGSVPKIPDVGYYDSDNVDLSNRWMPKGAAPPMPGFNGKTYVSYALAPTNETGQTTGAITLIFRPTGVWEAIGNKANAIGEGTVVLDSGTWLPAGQSAGDFTVRFSVGGGTGQGTISNTAASAQNLAGTQSVTLITEVPAASAQYRVDSRVVTVTIGRVSAGSTTASLTMAASASGWF